jgi:hypothetical protein
VERLLAKLPDERFQSPGEMLQAVEEVAEAVAPRGRRSDAPLEWTADDAKWLLAGTDAPGPAAVAAPPTAPLRARAGTVALREATQHLRVAVARDRDAAVASRRLWLATGLAAAAALATGFWIGRARGRRSELFRLRR